MTLMLSKNFLKKVKCRVKVGSKAKGNSFRLIGCQDLTRESCMAKLCQSATEGMTIDEDTI